MPISFATKSHRATHTLLLFAMLGASSAHAAPMGFKDSWMLMTDFSPNWREAAVNYAVTGRDALGASVLDMKSDDKRLERRTVEATYTRRLARWNLPDAQANIWLLAGVGGVRGNDFAGTKTLFSPGVQMDYETTRVYLAATTRLYRAPGLNHDFNSLRAGFSFYEAGFDETQPWFVLEARRMRGLSAKVEITPLLRLINKSYFVDIGVNNFKQARLNFMYTY